MEKRFHDLGFRTVIVSSSGQRRGARHETLALDGDLLALAPDSSRWPHFICEVGGRSKSVVQSLLEMRQFPLPAGFVPIVARLTDSRRKRWRWHLKSDDAHDTLEELLAALAS